MRGLAGRESSVLRHRLRRVIDCLAACHSRKAGGVMRAKQWHSQLKHRRTRHGSSTQPSLELSGPPPSAFRLYKANDQSKMRPSILLAILTASPPTLAALTQPTCSSRQNNLPPLHTLAHRASTCAHALQSLHNHISLASSSAAVLETSVEAFRPLHEDICMWWNQNPIEVRRPMLERFLMQGFRPVRQAAEGMKVQADDLEQALTVVWGACGLGSRATRLLIDERGGGEEKEKGGDEL